MPIIEPDSDLYDDTENNGIEQQIVDKNSIISAVVGIQWQGRDCQFSDWSFLPCINLWRDYLPAEFESKIPGQKTGSEIRHKYRAGEILDENLSNQQHQVSKTQFQPPRKGISPIIPQFGRYYPRDFFMDINGVYKGNKFPCRITAIEDDCISVDLRHPLAGKDFEMIMRVKSIKAAGSERGGRCTDITATVTEKGPGMQDCLAENETDFFSDNPFQRLDEGNDEEFFKFPDYNPFWDIVALAQVSEIYTKLIPANAKVLDLMAGAHSPLQDAEVEVDSVICAGLNEEEMAANLNCHLKIKVDVNSMTSLPFDSGQFDTVLIHAAIEYVIKPDLLFAEINRVLKPSGRIIISFSNRSIAEKRIQLWAGAHEFERPAIVLSYLRSNGGFANFNSYSMRDLFRPDDDKLADKLLYSDPVYVVWADKHRR